jgi:L-malate glycosyltransferase
MIRIAFVIDSVASSRAGTEKQLLMLLHGLDRRRFEPTLVCLRSSDWLSTQSFPFDVRVLNVGKLANPSTLAGLWSFRKLQREKRFDIVQTFFIEANIFGTLVARFSGIPNVVSSRRNIGYWHTRIHTGILRLLEPMTPFYLANSNAALEVTCRVERVPARKITVIYNGLDLEPFDGGHAELRAPQRREWKISDDEILVGAIANLRPVKNLSSLVHAASILKASFPRLSFTIIGEGPDQRRLEDQIRAAGLEDRVVLRGPSTAVSSCLAAFDIAVQCSCSESFSNSLVEYMAAGLPIAASAVGGNVEALAHGETGVLYEPDGGNNLAAALKDLVSNPARARAMGARARQVSNRYSMQTCIRSHEEYYEKIVGGGR